MGKHAYLILAHKNIGQLQRLIELLDHPDNDIFVHVDAKNKEFHEDDCNGLTKYSRLYFLPKRYNVNWGGVSIMRSELALLKAATEFSHYDYYHLLSGMDLPIKTQDEIHEFFERNKGYEFINLWKVRKSNVSRFKFYTLFPEGELNFRTRFLNQIFKGLQMLVGFRINRNIDFHMGSQWFSITDDLARYVVAKSDWLEKVFRHTSTCDEVFLPTLVCNSSFKKQLYVSDTVDSNRAINESNMRFIDWTRGESVRHPWIFRKDDRELLDSVPHLWARKFDENVDAKIIDIIYRKLKQ